MEIKITVPEIKCTRCSTTAPLQPHLIYLKSAAPPKYREVFSTVTREEAAATATDDTGRKWDVLVSERPVGWTKGPDDSVLCAACDALWREAGRTFLIPPPPPPVEVVAEGEEAAPLPVAPVFSKKRLPSQIAPDAPPSRRLF